MAKKRHTDAILLVAERSSEKTHRDDCTSHMAFCDGHVETARVKTNPDEDNK